MSEQALQVGLRPVLFNARPHDPPQKVRFIDDHWVHLRDGLASVEAIEQRLYLAIALRNVASGMAIVHGWDLAFERAAPVSPIERFRRNTRDLYVPAGDNGFWQAAIRDPGDELHGRLAQTIAERRQISVDILYGDHEGGQRTVTRFALLPRDGEDDRQLWSCSVSRHWNLDRADPR